MSWNNYQIICHYNIHNDLPDSENNGRIFGIFLDNIKASNKYMKLCDDYEPNYIDFRTTPVIQHDEINDICPEYSEPGPHQISPLNRERIDIFSFVNKYNIPNYTTIMKLRGTKLYVIKNTIEAQNNGWDSQISSYVGGVYTHRCCAEKHLAKIIQEGLYYDDDKGLYYDGDDDDDENQPCKFPPIIKEYTEGVPDVEYEKNRKAFKDLTKLINDMKNDPNHPGRKWPEFGGDEDPMHWEEDICLYDFSFSNSFSDALEDYLNWMKDKMNMDLQVETLGFKTKEMQLYYAYNEIFKLKNRVDRCHVICKMIDHCSNNK
jgi:hypothetical protein